MASSSPSSCGSGLSLRRLSSDPPRLRPSRLSILPLDPKPSPCSSLHGTRKISCAGARRRMYFTVNSHMATEPKPAFSEDQMLVFVPPHPLIKHWVSVLRNEQTPCPIFKNAMAELGRLLMYEASRDWLPTIAGEIQSPMGVASVEFIDPREPVVVIPILRAGLALVEYASSILPAAKTYHLGISRNEETLQPTVYLNKLPDRLPDGSRVFVVDPMLATGGTIVAALNLLKERGVNSKQIKVISAVAAPPALQKLSENFPGLHVYTGIIDPTVNDKGFIIPGLGDAGCYNIECPGFVYLNCQVSLGSYVDKISLSGGIQYVVRFAIWQVFISCSLLVDTWAHAIFSGPDITSMVLVHE